MAFHPCMRARWQRWKRHGNALTLISSSRCTRWCIDCGADQPQTFGSSLFGGVMRLWTGCYHSEPPSKSEAAAPSRFRRFSQGNSLRWVCLSVRGCQREFWKVLTYCSRRDDRQCDYAEGCVSANTKAGTSPLHLLSFAAPVKNVYSRVEPALPPRPPGSLYDMRGFVIVMSSSQRRRRLLMIESCPAQESHGAACWGVWCLQRYIVRLVVTARLK